MLAANLSAVSDELEKGAVVSRHAAGCACVHCRCAATDERGAGLLVVRPGCLVARHNESFAEMAC